MNSEERRMIKDRLMQWARYSLMNSDNIGFQHENILKRLQRDGGFLPRGTKREITFTETDEQIEEIEKLFAELSKESEKNRLVAKTLSTYFLLRQKYDESESEIVNKMARWLTAKLKTDSVRTIRDRIKRGMIWFDENIKKKKGCEIIQFMRTQKNLTSLQFLGIKVPTIRTYI